jgi:protein-tyrosine phosphatase
MMRKLSYISFIAAPLCVLLFAGCGSSNSKSQDVNAPSFSVERNKTDKVYTLNIEGDGHWQVFAGETPSSIDTTIVVAEGNGTDEVNITSFPPNKRVYFQYVLENNTKIIASERLLPMQGAYNARDIGGYKTVEGKTVKWGKVFRTGSLNTLTSSDTEYLENIGIKTVVDFRYESERNSAPDANLVTVINRFNIPIQTAPTTATGKDVLIEANKLFVTDFQAEYKGFFAALMNENNPPLLFHCSAGKDRAGFAAAMFLSALGVDKETVIKDYLLSAVYRAELIEQGTKLYPELAPLLTVYREYIEAAFDTIDKEYGSVENYLREQLDVDLGLMRVIYTE